MTWAVSSDFTSLEGSEGLIILQNQARMIYLFFKCYLVQLSGKNMHFNVIKVYSILNILLSKCWKGNGWLTIKKKLFFFKLHSTVIENRFSAPVSMIGNIFIKECRNMKILRATWILYTHFINLNWRCPLCYLKRPKLTILLKLFQK